MNRDRNRWFGAVDNNNNNNNNFSAKEQKKKKKPCYRFGKSQAR